VLRTAGALRAWADPERRDRRLEAQRAVMQTPEYRETQRQRSTGRTHSPETRERIGRANAIALRGKTLSQEHRRAIGKGLVRTWAVDVGRHWRAHIFATGNRFSLDAPVKGECAYCLAPATTYDHVLPSAVPYGGSDDPRNLVPACTSCNSSKSNRDPWTWLHDGLRRESRIRVRRIKRQEATALLP
jgi:5-methylcytosine-specific restriction endonuclease McrA